MYRFWSQIIYDKSLQASLISFLQEAPRFYSEEKEILKTSSPNAWNIFKEIQNLMFLIFVRLATHKESKVLLIYLFTPVLIYSLLTVSCFLLYDFLKENFISPEVFGQLLYDNFIFDIPKMMDLCVLFGPTNSVLLGKMFMNIFTHQPKYKFDLEETAKGLDQVCIVWNFFICCFENVSQIPPF